MINGKAVALGSIGGLFVYSGLSGFSVLKGAQNIIQGKPASDGQTSFLLSADTTASAGNAGGSIGPGAAKAKAYARAHLADYGWGPDQYDPLVTLWTNESGWNYKAHNPSGATGIPQALPASKMASEGADYMTNPATQIRWGLKYIKGRYGTPAAALAFWEAQNPHWY